MHLSYLTAKARPIFLHFLNREALLASKHTRNEELDIAVIDCLTVTHASKMTVNISQLLEYSHSKDRLTSVLAGLFASGIIKTTSHDVNMDEFITSRQRLYINEQSRYPMYFQPDATLAKFGISSSNSFSMTDVLRKSILLMQSDALPLDAKRARVADLQMVQRSLDPIQTLLMKERGIPMTKTAIGLFAPKGALEQIALDSLGRIFSALYFEYYAGRSLAATSSGVDEVGYVEDYQYFPHYDVPVLGEVLTILGWKRLKTDSSDLRSQVNELYASPAHRSFVNWFHSFMAGLTARACLSLNSPAIEASTVVALRSMIIGLANHWLGLAQREISVSTLSFGHFISDAGKLLSLAGELAARDDPTFRHAWRESLLEGNVMKFLLMTATDTEDDVLRKQMLANGYPAPTVVGMGGELASRYSKGGNLQIYHARSSAGSTGVSGSELTTADAIRGIEPDYVISVGVCFGLKSDKHELGDVLISERVVDYETVRVEPEQLRERGPRTPAGHFLLSAARIARGDFAASGKRAHIGEFISGQKLVDSKELLNSLIERYPDAIGGEMEGNGVYSASQRASKEWIIVKGICDWGMNKDKKKQELAAENAVSFALSIVETVWRKG